MCVCTCARAHVRRSYVYHVVLGEELHTTGGVPEPAAVAAATVVRPLVRLVHLRAPRDGLGQLRLAGADFLDRARVAGVVGLRHKGILHPGAGRAGQHAVARGLGEPEVGHVGRVPLRRAGGEADDAKGERGVGRARASGAPLPTVAAHQVPGRAGVAGGFLNVAARVGPAVDLLPAVRPARDGTNHMSMLSLVVPPTMNQPVGR